MNFDKKCLASPLGIFEESFINLESFLASSLLQTTVLVMIVNFLTKNKKIKKFNFFNLGFFIFCCCLILTVNDNLNSLSTLSNLNNDFLSFVFKTIICFLTLLLFYYKSYETQTSLKNSFEYYVFISSSALGSIILCSTVDFLTTYLAIELQTISFYFMSCVKKNSNYSVESSLKYFVVGSMSSAIFLLGSSLIYGFSGTLEFKELSVILESFSIFNENLEIIKTQHNLNVNPPYLYLLFPELFMFSKDSVPEIDLLDLTLFDVYCIKLNSFSFGLALVYIALLIKLAAAPFHYWSLEVYEGSPNVSTLFFSTVPKIGLLVVLLRIFYLTTFTISIENHVLEIFIFFSFLSLLLGSLGGLCQKKIKTLMAHSSTNYVGYFLLCFSSGTLEGLTFMFYYLFVYLLSTSCFWFSFMLLKKRSAEHHLKNNKELGDLISLKSSNPCMALIISISLFSLSGMPPFIGFLVKFNLFVSLSQTQVYFISMFSILISVISTFYYLRVIKVLQFETKKTKKLYYSNSLTQSLVVIAIFFFLILLFIKPSFFYLIAHRALLTLN